MASLNPYSGTLTRQQAAHLLRRATLGPKKSEIDTYTGMSAASAVDAIYAQTSYSPAKPIDPDTGTSFVDREEHNAALNPLLRFYIRDWWIKQMLETPASALEKMVFFMHTHFTTSQDKVGLTFPMYHQNALFRKYALGNLKTLAKKVCRDYAMSVYLDGWKNITGSPNENFAREFMELFTIGKGEEVGAGNYTTYTENDVRAAARVLTGFSPTGVLSDTQITQYSTQLGIPLTIQNDPDTGLYTSTIIPAIHDFLPKTFSSAFQNTVITSGTNTVSDIENELDAFVNMLFNQSATAEYICRKLYRFFVYYNITQQVEDDIIQPLAADLKNGNYELLPVIKKLLKSEHFFDMDDSDVTNNNTGAIIKSPIELLVGTFRYFNIPVGDNSNWIDHYAKLTLLDGFAINADMSIFEPPEVAGYPAYHQEPAYNRNWLSANNLVNRYGAAYLLLLGYTFTFNMVSTTVKLDSVDFTKTSGNFSNPADPNVLVDTLVNDLLPFGVDATKRAQLKDDLVDGGPDHYWANEWTTYTSGGSDSVVRLRLDALFNAILQSPEYQLS